VDGALDMQECYELRYHLAKFGGTRTSHVCGQLHVRSRSLATVAAFFEVERSRSTAGMYVAGTSLEAVVVVHHSPYLVA